MDFYITLTSSPTKHHGANIDLKDPLNWMENTSQNMDMLSLKINANDGESVETIIKNANYKLCMEWSSSQLGGKPKIVLNEDNLEFCK
ncbi:unnamed protein product [Brachionus calyciflorus]|uniref:Uncharacterized protein n=1 Tax=Brachionus calyciflorus TaxID=104777 RepID=A0A814B900_9BILA|nr:unnamed protein product [Brachionus calyciflorus]